MEGIIKTEDQTGAGFRPVPEGSQPPSPHSSASEEQMQVEESRPSVPLVRREEMVREMMTSYMPQVGSRQQYTSQLFQEGRNRLFHLNLDKNNSLQESELVRRNGKLLDRFLTIVLSQSFSVDDPIPPFSINATQDFFERENYDNFIDVLLKCGGSLVKLTLEFPRDGGSMSFLLPFRSSLSLPALTDFKVQFVDDLRPRASKKGTNAMSLHLLKSIFEGSHHSLKTFNLLFTEEENTIPTGLEYLTLPITITTLELSGQMKSEDLKVLLNSSLPDLKYFSLAIPRTPFDDGLISRILEKFAETLEKVKFDGITYAGVHNTTTAYFAMPPIMKKLKHLCITSSQLELQSGSRSFETDLPKLNELVLKDQTGLMFLKWADICKFENMLELRLSLVDKTFPDCHKNYYVNTDLEVMECLDLAFPNLNSLEITVCGDEMAGLKHLFAEMRQLEKLKIYVRSTETLKTSDFWDSLLIGVAIEIAGAMRKAPGFSESFEIKDLPSPSIRNLRKLRSLKIATEGSPSTLARVPLISDSVFHFGFFKMRKLKKLWLSGRFVASQEMTTQWRAKVGQEIIHREEQRDLD